MATIAIGDVHGNLAALEDLVDRLKGAVDDDDVIVFLGDYIDRGPSSQECVEAILALQRDLPTEVVCLCGNHEDWLLRTLHDYGRHSWLLGMEAFDTIRSYSPEAAQVVRRAASNAGSALYLGQCELPYDAFFDCVPKTHLQFFEGLRTFYQSADCLCTHGGLDPRVADVQDQTREALIWGAGGFPDDYAGTQIVVYGHRNDGVIDTEGWPTPRIGGRTIGLDTIAHGVLTAVRLPDQRVFQSGRHTA